MFCLQTSWSARRPFLVFVLLNIGLCSSLWHCGSCICWLALCVGGICKIYSTKWWVDFMVFDYHFFIIVVIITWPREKPWEKITLTSHLSGSLIGSNGLIYSKLRAWSQFSTNKGTLSVFCCFLFAFFNNCWSTTPSF